MSIQEALERLSKVTKGFQGGFQGVNEGYRGFQGFPKVKLERRGNRPEIIAVNFLQNSPGPGVAHGVAANVVGDLVIAFVVAAGDVALQGLPRALGVVRMLAATKAKVALGNLLPPSRRG